VAGDSQFEKLSSPAARKALATLTALLGGVAARDVAKGGHLQTLGGRAHPFEKKLLDAMASQPQASLRLEVMRQAPAEVMLPAKVTSAAGSIPISVATSSRELERHLRKMLESGDDIEHLVKMFKDQPGYLLTVPSKRLPGPEPGTHYIETIIGGQGRGPRSVAQHEIGHLKDLMAGGPNYRMIDQPSALRSVAEKLFGPAHQRGIMAQERAAWEHVPDGPGKDALKDLALKSYDMGFHRDRAPVAASAAGLSAALLAAMSLRDRRRAREEEGAEVTEHVKEALDPLSAGTLGVMLPAAILRALGTGGYAGRLSRGTGWRKPVISATDAAVNRAAEGIGDLAMATAGLNWTMRKSIEAAGRKRHPDLPREEPGEREAREAFMADLDELTGMQVTAAAFDDELRKHAAFGRLKKLVGAADDVGDAAPSLQKLLMPFAEKGANLGLSDAPAAAKAAVTVARNPRLAGEAEGIFQRFKGDPAQRAKFPRLAEYADEYPEPRKISLMKFPGLAKRVLGDKQVVQEGQDLFKDVYGKKLAAAFDDELDKLAGRFAGVQRSIFRAIHDAADGVARRTAPRVLRAGMTDSPHMLDLLSAAMLRMGDVRAAVEFDRIGRAGSRVVRKGLLAQVPGLPKGSLLPPAAMHRLASSLASAPEAFPLAMLPGGSMTTPAYMAAKRKLVKRIGGAGLVPGLQKASAVKVSPPPKRNRTEYPFSGAIQFQDLPEILVENRKGSVRSGVGPKGKVWKTTMPAHYGEFRRTKGADGDPVDVYVGPNEKSTNVYIVHTRKPPTFKRYDEDKVFIGFDSAAEVAACMRAAYDDKRFLGSMTSCSVTDLKKVLKKRSARGAKLDQTLVMAKAEGSLWTGFDEALKEFGFSSGAPRAVLWAAR